MAKAAHHTIRYAIPADQKSWVDRVERACAALEGSFQGTRLLNAVDAEEPDHAVSDRRRFLKERLRHSTRAFTLDAGGEAGSPTYVQALGCLNDPGEAVYDLSITFGGDNWSAVEQVLGTVGDAVQAYHAQLTPLAARKALVAYYGVATGRPPFIHRPDDMREAEKLKAALSRVKRQLPPFGAPLTDLIYMRPEHPAQPKELGWMNYWSPSACEYLGFPTPERDRELLAHSHVTPTGAWIVKLSPDPLDLARDDHVAALADGYARFPNIGLSALRKTKASPIDSKFPQSTAFVKESNHWHVIERLTPLLKQRGFDIVERPAKGKEYLTIAVFPGAPGWSVVKTIPPEFLAEKHSSGEAALAALCRAAEREGVLLAIRGETDADVLSSDKNGRLRDAPSVLMELDVLDVDDYRQLAQQVYANLGGRNADLCDDENFSKSLDGDRLRERQGVTLRFQRR